MILFSFVEPSSLGQSPCLTWKEQCSRYIRNLFFIIIFPPKILRGKVVGALYETLQSTNFRLIQTRRAFLFKEDSLGGLSLLLSVLYYFNFFFLEFHLSSIEFNILGLG